jgi:ketosteroid isomerase-like protein
MAERPIDVVRLALAAFEAKDLDAAFALAHEDAVFDWSNSISPYAGVVRGHDEMRRLMADFLDTWQEVSWSFDDVVEIDAERVIIATRVRMRVRDNLETEARGAQLWTVRDGKVAEAKLFQSLADAQAAVAGA